MVIEAVDEIVITMEEANAHFDQVCQLRHTKGKKFSQDEIGALLGVNQSTVSRNKRRRRAGEDISDDLFEIIANILRDQRIEELRRRNLRTQREREGAEEAQRQADLKEARLVDEEKNRLADLVRWAERERRVRVLRALKPYREDLRRKGIIEERDDRLHGDAAELAATAYAIDIRYPDASVAEVALAPDDHVLSCGRTAAELRKGVSAIDRARGNFPASIARTVHATLRHDARGIYGKHYRMTVIEWHALNEDLRHLALGRLPLTISPDEAKKFKYFLRMHRFLQAHNFQFEDACLDACDIEARLRAINLRSSYDVIRPAMLAGLKRAAVLVLTAANLWLVGRAINDLLTAV